ncbi:hypothetical protein RCH09_001781 [Actimicrobium sp. GrIS 1.19]|nr:hypothetical protein [Actimicrobium sp. GrIS 1.19]
MAVERTPLIGGADEHVTVAEMFMALTQDFLRARGIDNLLAPRWEARNV